MSDIDTKPQAVERTKTKPPPLYKVILLNDDYTPREFVVVVLKAVFRMTEDNLRLVGGDDGKVTLRPRLTQTPRGFNVAVGVTQFELTLKAPGRRR